MKALTKAELKAHVEKLAKAHGDAYRKAFHRLLMEALKP